VIHKPTTIFAIALMAFIAVNASAQGSPSDVQNRCGYRAWINAFHPEQPVFPKSTDRCPADESNALFTREGTLACSTLEGFQLAYNAMEHGWSYVPTAGVPTQPGEYSGMPVSPEHFGCAIYHDGVAVQISRENFSAAETNIGWVARVNLRNAPVEVGSRHPKIDSALRPKLCDKHGKKCVYTDVHPYEPVKEQ
jgi:hypothetical protein